MSGCQSKEPNIEVSRSHSSEETFVMSADRRAESLKRVIFLEVVKATTVEKQTGKKSVAFSDQSNGRTRNRQPAFCGGCIRML
jgi:hypothetical protein